MSLRIGQRAPDFDVTSSSGKPLKLGNLVGKKNVVLYFYPGDFTPLCTKETCGFRDAFQQLEDSDTEVIGVSVDSDESHRKFAKQYGLSFELVSDPNREIARSYEATGFFSNLMGKTSRITYVIDKKGLIAGVFASELSASKHVDGAKLLVAKLA